VRFEISDKVVEKDFSETECSLRMKNCFMLNKVGGTILTIHLLLGCQILNIQPKNAQCLIKNYF